MPEVIWSSEVFPTSPPFLKHWKELMEGFLTISLQWEIPLKVFLFYASMVKVKGNEVLYSFLA